MQRYSVFFHILIESFFNCKVIYSMLPKICHKICNTILADRMLFECPIFGFRTTEREGKRLPKIRVREHKRTPKIQIHYLVTIQNLKTMVTVFWSIFPLYRTYIKCHVFIEWPSIQSKILNCRSYSIWWKWSGGIYAFYTF